MATTSLSIVFIDNIDNCNQISFTDLSDYNPDIEVKTPVVKILYPDFTVPVSLSYTPYTTNIVKVNTGDGLYTVEISVCPNDKIKKTFYYFKVCQLMNILRDNLCKFSGNIDKVKELMESYKLLIATQLIAQKEPEKAKVIYSFVKSKLNC